MADLPRTKFNSPWTVENIETELNGVKAARGSGTMSEALAAKQNELTFDSTPTYGSSNPVTSGGVYSAIQGISGSNPYTSHNNGIRGAFLGIDFTAEQKAAIADGSFDNLYVGDYWMINNIKYVIVDIDYYLNYGDPTPTTDHHVIVYPDKVLSSQGYSYDSNYYGGSSIYTNYLPAIASDLTTIFGNFLINQPLVLYGGSGSAFWGSSKCIIPSIIQLQGYPQEVQHTKMQYKVPQFAYFRYSGGLIAANSDYWLRDSNGDGNTMMCSTTGSQGLAPNNSSYYLRPYFMLAGTQQSS